MNADLYMTRRNLAAVVNSHRASGLVVKSNVAIVGPRVRFSAGARRILCENESFISKDYGVRKC